MTTNYREGVIVHVPFPFIDRPVQKLRPALVLSTATGSPGSDMIVLAMITSARRSSWPTDIALHDWEAAGLKAPCVVRFKLFSLDSALVHERRGELTVADRARVSDGLRTCFGAWFER